MICIEEWNAGEGVLMVRTADTVRPKELDRRIAAEGWIALMLFSRGDLVFEAWGRLNTGWAGLDPDEFTIPEAAAFLGISTDELLDRMAEDGLILETDDGRIASPSPDVFLLDRD